MNTGKAEKIIYLIRHGQSEQNQKSGACGKIFSGSTDTKLSEKGKKQAKELGKSGMLTEVRAVYTSDLSRAIETAHIIFGEKPVYYQDKRLRELDFGSYEGKAYQPENTEDQIMCQWTNTPFTMTFPGGDNVEQHQKESYEALLQLARNTKEPETAVVTHCTTIRLLLNEIKEEEKNSFRKIACDNCSVTKLSFDGEKFKILFQNRTI